MCSLSLWSYSPGVFNTIMSIFAFYQLRLPILRQVFSNLVYRFPFSTFMSLNYILSYFFYVICSMFDGLFWLGSNGLWILFSTVNCAVSFIEALLIYFPRVYMMHPTAHLNACHSVISNQFHTKVLTPMCLIICIEGHVS